MEVDSEGATLAPPPAPAREVKTGSELGLPVVNASGSETLRVGPEESDRDAAIDPLLTGAAPSLAMDVDPQRGAASNNETSVDQKIAPPSSAKLSGSGSALAIQTKTVHEDLVEDDSAIQTQSSIRDQREETAGSQVGGTTIVSEPQPQYHDGILSRRKSMPPSPRKPIESLPPAPPALISSKPSLLPSSSPHQSGRSMADVTAVSHANSSFESTGAFQQQQPDGPADEDDMDDGDDATVDDEGGVIRCICGYDTDDGFTIQCERCLVWQHCACFGMSQASVPDEYLEGEK
ncbi:histone-lysine n-methyltransferase mll5 [Ceraceosorus bombacis]|uniref:Histone-lysine n-methyltransferase mll5 n=1 Tax=Ceraceosorus bombacis TaxID=401625 RepID=A0A0P1BF04_9BASI|nr:histone-lysine n-methyltransferase mll5 [Ceraceosorus bombacis]